MKLRPVPVHREGVAFVDRMKRNGTCSSKLFVNPINDFSRMGANRIDATELQFMLSFRHRSVVHFDLQRMGIPMRRHGMRCKDQQGQLVRIAVSHPRSFDALASGLTAEYREFHSSHMKVEFMFGVPELNPTQLSINPLAAVAVEINSLPGAATQRNVAR